MRFWPSPRRPAVSPPPSDDSRVVEDVLCRRVDDVFDVRARAAHGRGVVFTGALKASPGRALDILLDRLGPIGYTPRLRRRRAEDVLEAWPLRETTAPRVRVGLNVMLFLLTCLTTLIAGSGAFLVFDPLAHPARLLAGVPFAFTLLAILGTHEFGHYFTARHHGAAVSLPYFIPAPPPFLFGTLGAIIRMGSAIRDRNALFDIAVAGPLAGLVVAIPAVMVGLGWSAVAAIPTGGHIVFGDSLLMRGLVYLIFGRIPAGMDVFIHPVALAGWVGLFVTALNLFPVGQLDGGRIAYALFGRHHRTVGYVTVGSLVALAAVTWAPNWLVWAALVFFFVGVRHSPPLDDVTPLTPRRRLLGYACLGLLVLLIPPVPIQIG
jgi:membrane-associated protease RseP (regulator of RpoE activity)